MNLNQETHTTAFYISAYGMIKCHAIHLYNIKLIAHGSMHLKIIMQQYKHGHGKHNSKINILNK